MLRKGLEDYSKAPTKEEREGLGREWEIRLSLLLDLEEDSAT